MRPTPILSTLVYAIRDDALLLMRRSKPPNLGLWVAPGGKLEINESPVECARRELLEETGLHAPTLDLRAIILEWSPREDWQWLMFCYVTRDPQGEVRGDEREGLVRWWPLPEALSVPMPEADQVFLPPILAGRFYQARMVYDADLNLVEVIEET